MLQISNLSKTYPNGVQALKDVSLTISNGMFGLLGPNGAGKSSLMRTIATLQDADTGTITFNGINVLTQKQELRKTLGYLPQEFGVYPRVSAEEMLHYIARLKGITNDKERKELVKALLEQVNLYNHRNKFLGGYSGGMKQRFGIAQALIGDPKLIIVDEPTAGLDPAERLRFNNLLSEIGENIVVILSTHIVEDVSELCNDMAIIAGGKVVQRGVPQEMLNAFGGKIWSKQVAKDEVAGVQEQHRLVLSKLSGGKMVVHIYSDTDPGNGYVQEKATLEDIYFANIS
ncbi:ABC transporter ATP-binding protein [Nemorincola caseinilytica]|uniref:ABC transporter ATP-binding protein n=1 Tax=Nemorincola caseinilytica TaxID=2054315 RepID=A0ABP8N9N7_9BACT